MPPPASDTELAYASIEEIARLFRKRKLSPLELAKIVLKRIEETNPRLNAYLTVSSAAALMQARKAESELLGGRSGKARVDRGPLHGVPISVKDNIYTAGIRTTAGSRILRDFIPLHDAPVVASLKQAGAVLLGKTNLHEFAYGVTCNNPHFGPARNPWDRERIPGGSSGGSAAAVAAGLCYGSIGTDTGGSIRIPAALCGVAGFKPGPGRISDKDVVPLSPTLDFVGPIARTVADAALLAEPIFVRGRREPPLHAGTKPRKQKISCALGIPREFFFDQLAGEVRSAYDSAISLLRKLGVRTKTLSIPALLRTEDAGNLIAWPEATHYHQSAGWFPGRADEYGEDVRSRLELGRGISAVDYLKALEQREEFINELHAAMNEARVDALAVPATAIAAPLIGEESTSIDGEMHPTRALLLRLNRPANLAGVPAIAVPGGFTPAGLPVGIQFIGRLSGEGVLVTIASHFERHGGLPRRPPL